MNASRSDTRRALIGYHARKPCCLGGYTNPFERDNVGTLSKSSEFLHVAHSLKSATSSSGKVLLSSANYVQFWFRRFRSGIFDVKDAPRTCRPFVENVDKITEIIQVDRHVSSASIA
ncbi:hypothetical protein TNCV_2571291 [Trichonephila clavipes]|nr:hypothetical protein TNCV_2571291 [Trichonephila clavipes]